MIYSVSRWYNSAFMGTDTKKVAKSIILVEEVPSDKLSAEARKFYMSAALNNPEINRLIYEIPDSYFDFAIENGVDTAIEKYKEDLIHGHIETLKSDGYCEGFAKYIAEKVSEKYNFAHEVASWEGLSMAERINIVLNCEGE